MLCSLIVIKCKLYFPLVRISFFIIKMLLLFKFYGNFHGIFLVIYGIFCGKKSQIWGIELATLPSTPKSVWCKEGILSVEWCVPSSELVARRPLNLLCSLYLPWVRNSTSPWKRKVLKSKCIIFSIILFCGIPGEWGSQLPLWPHAMRSMLKQWQGESLAVTILPETKLI